MGPVAGSKNITASGEVTANGTPTRIFSIHIVSNGGGGAVITLTDNGSSGTLYIKETGTVSTGKTFYYGDRGFLFKDGCYVTVDTNTTSVLVNYEEAL